MIGILIGIILTIIFVIIDIALLCSYAFLARITLVDSLAVGLAGGTGLYLCNRAYDVSFFSFFVGLQTIEFPSYRQELGIAHRFGYSQPTLSCLLCTEPAGEHVPAGLAWRL